MLGEKCSDLDYTAVRVGIGRGDDESDIIGAGDCERGGGRIGDHGQLGRNSPWRWCWVNNVLISTTQLSKLA